MREGRKAGKKEGILGRRNKVNKGKEDRKEKENQKGEGERKEKKIKSRNTGNTQVNL